MRLIWSKALFGFIAARKPTGTPTSVPSAMEISSSSSEAEMRVRISLSTGRPDCQDLPMSPCRTFCA